MKQHNTPQSREQRHRILAMNNQELNQYLNSMMLENPVLEIEETLSGYTGEDLAYKKSLWLESNDFEEGLGYFDPEAELPSREVEDLPGEMTLPQCLLEQLSGLTLEPRVLAAAQFIANTLDENGYLLATPQEIQAASGAGPREVEQALEVIHGLEPLGVGATGLSQCLTLQLDEEDTLARRLAEEFLPRLGEESPRQLAGELGAEPEEVALAVERIRKLNPKPGAAFGGRGRSAYLAPDLVMIKFPGEYYVALSEFSYPEVKLSQDYQYLLHSTDDSQTRAYLEGKLREAQELDRCVRYRAQVLTHITKTLVGMQQAFFRFGPHYLKLLTLPQLAQAAGLEPEEADAALKGKYLQTPYGVYPLKFFLSRERTMPRLAGVRESIQALIQSEPPQEPYPDEMLVLLLERQGVYLTREAVARCREELAIPDSSQRIFPEEGCGHSHDGSCGHCNGDAGADDTPTKF